MAIFSKEPFKLPFAGSRYNVVQRVAHSTERVTIGQHYAKHVDDGVIIDNEGRVMKPSTDSNYWIQVPLSLKNKNGLIRAAISRKMKRQRAQEVAAHEKLEECPKTAWEKVQIEIRDEPMKCLSQISIDKVTEAFREGFAPQFPRHACKSEFYRSMYNWPHIDLKEMKGEFKPTGESKMISIEKTTLINGNNVSNMSVEVLMEYIKQEQEHVNRLNDFPVASKAVDALKKKHEANIKVLVEILDSKEV